MRDRYPSLLAMVCWALHPGKAAHAAGLGSSTQPSVELRTIGPIGCTSAGDVLGTRVFGIEAR